MTLTQLETAINTGPTYNRLAAGACFTLRQRLNQGEAWSTQLVTDIADAHRQPLRDSGQDSTFRAMSGP